MKPEILCVWKALVKRFLARGLIAVTHVYSEGMYLWSTICMSIGNQGWDKETLQRARSRYFKLYGCYWSAWLVKAFPLCFGLQAFAVPGLCVKVTRCGSIGLVEESHLDP